MVADLSGDQKAKLEAYAELLAGFNSKINLISPNTVSSIWSTHIEHCLTFAHKSLPAGSQVVDWGTGGGLPLIPLAICFPDVTFTGVDAVRKKIDSVRVMARRLELDNVDAWHGRAEEWPGTAHYSISRATAPLSTLWAWHARACIPPTDVSDGFWAQGLICLKGGDLSSESDALTAAYPDVQITRVSVDTLLPSPLFSDKYIVHLVAGPSL